MMAGAKKKKGFTDYLAQAWGTAKKTAKRDMGRIKTAIGAAPTGVKAIKADRNMNVKDVELHRVRDIGKK